MDEDEGDTITLVTTAAVTLADDSLAEGDTTTLTARLKDPLTVAATLTLSHDGGLISFSDTELVFMPGETETAITVTAINNNLADAVTRVAAIASRSDNISSVVPERIGLSIEPDDEAIITPQPTRLTLNEGQTTDVVFIVAPPLAQPAAIIAIPSDEDQIALSSTQLTVAAGQARITLSVAAIDDDIKEPETSHTIDLSIAGHATLAEDQIAVTVPVDGGDTNVDIDRADNAVAENSPVGTPVGITVQVTTVTDYTLIDSVDGLFAIGRQSGVVTVAIAMLDHEAFSSHSITVQANDGVSSQTVSFVIQVTDVPETLKPVIDVDFNPTKSAMAPVRAP